MNPTQLSHIELCRAQMHYALGRMLVTFQAVPDDKLNWTPSPTAKTPLRILSHCVAANRAVTSVIRGEADSAVRDFDFHINERDEATRALEDSVLEYNAALDAMTPELFIREALSPAGPSPVSEWMHFIGWHLAEHACQIDYLQTCWDDQESRYPNE